MLQSYSLSLDKKRQEKENKFIFNQKGKYSYSPYDKKNRILHVSDRKIKIPMFLHSRNIKKIIDKINYYSSQNDYPIFLIMEYAFGGSWNASCLLIQAVENSKVPIYVFGGSVVIGTSSIILARAKYSFCYPETLISFGEITVKAILKLNGYSSTEYYAQFLKKVGKRAYNPIIKKMNDPSIKNLDQFYSRMRKENINRYWQEYGKNAKKYNWVSNVVDYVKDEGIDTYQESDNGVRGHHQLNNLPALDHDYDFYLTYQVN